VIAVDEENPFKGISLLTVRDKYCYES